ncbi:MAG TPA: hypothetical protein VNN07_17595 [Candidatus Tectomicrobia bacterium]|nr:hypothetical protein [Candidatus Tectomicrobia bacterium]
MDPDMIREKVDTGRLPARDPGPVWAGPGAGGSCDGCGDVILPAQVEYAFTDADFSSYRLHVACFGAWQAARSDRADQPASRREERRGDRGRAPDGAPDRREPLEER